MTAENLSWLKSNIRLFIDENLPCKVARYLNSRGYKQTYTVYDLNVQGKNDGVLHNVLKERKLILCTMDKHFYKQSCKYNHGMAILINKVPKTNINYSPYSISIQIELELLKKFKEIKEFYETNKNLS